MSMENGKETDSSPSDDRPPCQDARADASIPNFVEPERVILKQGDLPKWLRSQAYKDLIGFITTLNESIKGRSLHENFHVSEPVLKISAVLGMLDTWIDEIPPVEQPQRFGNKAFRDWLSKLNECAEDILSPILNDKYTGAVSELKSYFCDGFGNITRIDYGTGHEAAFCAFMCCLYKLRIFTERDNLALVFKVFHEYLELTRKLHKVYRMEPAGSQGVWGLDDFHFLPFIWGSSQLVDHPSILPCHLVEQETAIRYSNDYMFFGCIRYINETKTGPFAEHSNTLWNISSVPYWSKVNTGLMKMYKAEVLSKFPIVQHFRFGTLMSCKQA
ncbi:serine/threonine-protein phosphatase 2A activator-like [Rhopilema esculentum]|uniref:serine/threonine-protein phosphatase 2A activator-like n=1 Tax=Rhopilema esculentum TaxID=499914 RepID=UPI0031DCC247|eukprot:gene4467-20711_t